MNKKNYLQIVEHYENCFIKFGDNHKGVDWPKVEDTIIRYRTMMDLVTKNKQCSLLDFGCGAAHLYEFILQNSYQNIRYTGLDLSKELINRCRQKFSEITFVLADILETPDKIGEFDYIVLNGVFTEKRELSFDEMYEYFKTLIKVLYLKTKVGLAFNVMTKYVDWEREDLFHLSFDLLASFLKDEVTRNFIIRNDYGLFEYTVYLFKEPNTWHR